MAQITPARCSQHTGMWGLQEPPPPVKAQRFHRPRVSTTVLCHLPAHLCTELLLMVSLFRQVVILVNHHLRINIISPAILFLHSLKGVP